MKDKLIGKRTIAELKMLLNNSDVVRLSDGTIGKKTKAGGVVLYSASGERMTNRTLAGAKA